MAPPAAGELREGLTGSESVRGKGCKTREKIRSDEKFGESFQGGERKRPEYSATSLR